MSEELKSCPFCGNLPEPIDGQFGGYEHYCTAISTKLVASGEIAVWNSRPEEDRLRARIAELEAAVDEAIKELSK